MSVLSVLNAGLGIRAGLEDAGTLRALRLRNGVWPPKLTLNTVPPILWRSVWFGAGVRSSFRRYLFLTNCVARRVPGSLTVSSLRLIAAD